MKRIPLELESTVLRHALVDKWPPGTIARQLGIHHGVVRRVLAGHGLPSPKQHQRVRMIDPYLGFIMDMLEKYPQLHASRLHQMVQQRGYQGSQSHFRRLIAQLRPPKRHEPFLRLHKLPGEEAQVDWASFGTVLIGRAKRRLYAFVITLCWSRMMWLQFFFDMKMANFIRGHVDAFEFFGGVPRKLLYDNLKSAVLEREGNALRFNPQLLELANHFGFEPRAAAPRRGNEKGVVERSIRYTRSSFFAARPFHDIDRLNEEARTWLLEIAATRKWPNDDRRRVSEAFSDEQGKLHALPNDTFPAFERKRVRVGRTPWVRFDMNDYSVPHAFVRRTLDVLADHRTVRILLDGEVLAEHRRSFDRHEVIENPAHVEALRQLKRKSRTSSGSSRLIGAVPQAAPFLERAALHGHNLGGLTSRLLSLLNTHGTQAMARALTEVNEREIVNVKTVRQLLEQQARAAGRRLLVPVHLPRPSLAQLTVRPADLQSYDALRRDDEDDRDA